MATPTREEAFFLGELAAAKFDLGKVVATGYFLSFLESRRAASAFVEASRARGHFLALTESHLYVVYTRAPAFSAPLLENHGTVMFDLAHIRAITMDADRFTIELPVLTLHLEMRTDHRAFPNQGALLEQLAARFNLPSPMTVIPALRRRGRWRTAALVAVGVVGTIVYSLLT